MFGSWPVIRGSAYLAAWGRLRSSQRCTESRCSQGPFQKDLAQIADPKIQECRRQQVGITRTLAFGEMIEAFASSNSTSRRILRLSFLASTLRHTALSPDTLRSLVAVGYEVP